ncbi:hypothetical protein DSO57_1014683 [Entomophthora muscae]|uniref:Uncharacterized protein n=1 Tax=Entomophthora muscae TaxID=34485 RepID=A0ACC2SI57_9FUNG|nr:hypothetical protein DSO57_1014683 [Entomophthora muscae]
MDKQRLLLDAFQSQLDRMDSKIMAVNLQAMALNSKSLHSPQRFSSPKLYHSYKRNDGHVATKSPDLPANISYNTQGALNELPLDVSNNVNQSDGTLNCGHFLLIRSATNSTC